MNWLHYLLEANIYLAVFYAGYCLFLNKETHYTLNRAYLLLSCIISFVLPLIQISSLKPAEEQAQTYTTVVQNTAIATPSPVVNYQPPVSHFTLQDAVLYVYIIGIAVMAFLLAIKIAKLVKMTTNAGALANTKYKLITINGSNTAFSFFNYLFIGTKTTGADIIIRHELVHIRQKHSVDILFTELIRIISWFNPIVYLLQISLKTVHEYIADEQTAAQETDAITYSSFLVNNAYGLNGSSITHSFFNYNLLKKRIIMLNQQRSGKLARLKYLVAVPICAGMLCASTLAFSKNYALVDLAPNSVLPDTVVQHVSKPYVNAKGFTISEKSFTANGQAGFIATITDKQGKKLVADASKCNASGESMLYDVYGYKFPAKLKVKKIPMDIPPPPIAVKDNYVALFNHLNNTVNYPAGALKSNKYGVVGVSIKVKNDHKLTDVQIINNGGTEFNNEVLKSIKAFTGTVKASPGQHKLLVYFCTDYYKFIKTREAAIINDPSYDLSMLIYRAGKYPPMATGAKDLKAANVIAPPAAPVGITDANKLPPPPPPAPPIGIQADTPGQAANNVFGKYVARNIHYPALARDRRIGGRVIVAFNIVDGKITDPEIKRSLDPAMDEEVLRVVNSFNGQLDLKPGYYSVPVSFTLVDKNGQQVAHLPATIEEHNSALTANKPATARPVSHPSLSLNEVVAVAYTTD
jgi:TonB family protein